MKVAIYCGSSLGNHSIYAEKAEELGAFLAKQGIGIVYGGSNVGLMGKVADAALANGGEVIGVLPSFLQMREIAHEGLTDLFVVDSMHERKAKIAEMVDAFIALPGGPGTLEEYFEVFTWAQIGLHKKPICLYNINDYYTHIGAHFQHMLSEGFMSDTQKSLICVADSPEVVLDYMKRYEAVTIKGYDK